MGCQSISRILIRTRIVFKKHSKSYKMQELSGVGWDQLDGLLLLVGPQKKSTNQITMDSGPSTPVEAS